MEKSGLDATGCSMKNQSLAEYLVAKKIGSLNRLRELVEIESGSYDKSGVDKAGVFMESELLGLGFEIEKVPQKDIGDIIYARKSFSGKGRVLILGHLDTVWPTGTLKKWPFSIQPNGFATGPGIGDMKGGLIVALGAIDAVQECNLCKLESIAFMLISDEELGSPVSRPIIEKKGRESDWVLVMEPGRANRGVVTSRGAVGCLIVHTEGLTAHAGNNFKDGISAVRELARKIEPMESLSNPEKGLIINIGIFRGGEARQVVPGLAEMHIDLRAPSDAEMQKLISEINAILLANGLSKVKTVIEGGQTRPTYPRSAGVQFLYKKALEVASDIKIALPEVHSMGGSDGSFTSALGIPTLDGLGPIAVDVCSRRERIAIESLFERSFLLAGLIANLGG
jgi:glutamate carboxypeptidase